MDNYVRTGSISTHTYYYDNKDYLHRIDGPAVEPKKLDPKLAIEYYLHGKLHRIDGPARINRLGIFYWVNGNKHRHNGPAESFFVESDDIDNKSFRRLTWHVNDKFHRFNAPADINLLTGKKYYFHYGVRVYNE